MSEKCTLIPTSDINIMMRKEDLLMYVAIFDDNNNIKCYHQLSKVLANMKKYKIDKKLKIIKER